MKLAKLIYADIYRDGGSYGASFETDEGLIYSVWLQCSRMPDDEGLHHRWLFHYFGDARPEDCLPVVTGSDEERALIERLRSLLASGHNNFQGRGGESNDLERLNELLGYIERREPCFPFDLARQEFS